MESILAQLLFLSIADLQKIADFFQLETKIFYIDPQTKKQKWTGSRDEKIDLIEKIITQQKNPTVYLPQMVDFSDLFLLDHATKVCFGQYSSTNTLINDYLKNQTQSVFFHGQISFYIVRWHWKNAKVLTYKKLADLFLFYIENPTERMKKSCHYNNLSKKGLSKISWDVQKKQAKIEVKNYYQLPFEF